MVNALLLIITRHDTILLFIKLLLLYAKKQKMRMRRLTLLLSFSLLCLLAIQIWLYSFTSYVETRVVPTTATISKTTLLIMITSHSGDYSRRSVVRETYLSFEDRYNY